LFKIEEAAILSTILDNLKGEGWEITDEQLSYLSPLRWGHINLTGDYTRDSSRRTKLEHLQVGKP